MEAICSTGCALSWKGDGYCDEACFNAACEWDDNDCTAASEGCRYNKKRERRPLAFLPPAACLLLPPAFLIAYLLALHSLLCLWHRSDGCLPNWIDDEECDELCHNEACGYDGTDCGHETGGCYIESNGLDYRGNLAQTRSGHTCQLWSHQTPQVHTYTHLAYPHAGLGGHNYCRNPGGSQSHPWCYTTNPSVPWELCDVGAPSATSASCGDNKLITSSEGGHNNNPTQRYRTLCPIDCDAVLGNKVCDLRCNISSCAYDAGDCGVGKDIMSILSDQGYAQHTSPCTSSPPLPLHRSTALTPHPSTALSRLRSPPPPHPLPLSCCTVMSSRRP